LVQNFGSHAVKFREIRIQQDFFIAEDMNERRDLFRDQQRRGFFGGSFLLGGHDLTGVRR
jgi:hypothetical protein